MRRVLLITTLLLGFAASPASATGWNFSWQCTSGKLQATEGQVFNLNVVPHDFDDVIAVGALILRPATPGPFGNQVQVLAQAIPFGFATGAIPFQLDTPMTTDNAVEAYATLTMSLVTPACTQSLFGDPVGLLFCILDKFNAPGVALFRLGSNNMVIDGTDTVTEMDCRLDLDALVF